jgi:hypothetical protein
MGQFVGQFHFKKISPSPGRPKRAGTQYDGFHRFLVGQLVDLLEDLCAFPASDVGHVSERHALPLGCSAAAEHVPSSSIKLFQPR